MDTIGIKPGLSVATAFSFHGIVNYSFFLYKPDPAGWVREQVVQRNGSSEDAQRDEYDLPALLPGERRLVFIRTIMTSPVGNESVSTKVTFSQSGYVLGNVSASVEVTTGAKFADLRAILEANS